MPTWIGSCARPHGRPASERCPRCDANLSTTRTGCGAAQAQFAPLAVGARLWIVPSWHAAPDDPACVVIRLDPGLAFGTGSHPTTRLMLAWLEQRAVKSHAATRVLDYGCGSGILAIAAGKLGAAQIDGVDIDPQAIVATRDNAQRNGVELRALLPDALPDGEYDIVVANILANPLITLAPCSARVRDVVGASR